MNEEDERAVSSLPLDTEDGGTVVITQQNVGPANQVGGGEFKNSTGRSVFEAAADQAGLEHDAPIADPHDPDSPAMSDEEQSTIEAGGEPVRMPDGNLQIEGPNPD